MIIVISGHGRCGKDTFAAILKEKFESEYTLVAYADDLKKRCMDDFNLTYGQVYGDLKEVLDDRYIKSDGTYWTPREILQYMGTEGYRKINNDFWVDIILEKIVTEDLHNVIICDARFPNEIEKPKKLGAIHVRILRENPDEIHGKTHASETALDGSKDVDYYINNNGSLSDLELAAKSLIRKLEN